MLLWRPPLPESSHGSKKEIRMHCAPMSLLCASSPSRMRPVHWPPPNSEPSHPCLRPTRFLLFWRFIEIGFADKTLSLIHISEPTRLGMTSYAVFCLKK